jgi:hypothetical protein
MGISISSPRKKIYKKKESLLCYFKMFTTIDVKLQKYGVKEEMCGRVENKRCIINPPHCFT